MTPREGLLASYDADVFLSSANAMTSDGILVNIDGNRKLTFRPITPELSIKSYIVMKKYQAFSPPVKIFMNKIKNIL